MDTNWKQNKWLFLAVFLSCSQAYATPDIPGHSYPPIHIKPGTPTHAPSGLSPSQVKKAYGIDQIPFEGLGQIVAIVDAYDHPNIESDLGVFSSTFGLPDCTTANGCFKKIYADGTKPNQDAGWASEIALDVEWAHAIAPQAKIILVEATDNSNNALYKAIDVAVQNGANVISMSWGADEFSGESSLDSHFNVTGVLFTASSGDSGHATQYPAASPYVLSVGGTTLNVDSAGNYQSEKAWSGSGGGISKYINAPAYQTSFLQNNPNKMRGIPDVSYNADPNTGVSVYDSIPLNNGRVGWLVSGGTSAGAPQWAALIAVANSALCLINVTTITNSSFYSAAAGSSYSQNYFDITTGNNGSCGALCNASSGYDYVTGLGSPHAHNLVNFLSAALRASIQA